MKAFLTHYSGDWTWAKDFEYEIWNRSDEDIPGSVPRENVGDADYDKLDWLVQNYDTLPDVFLWTKSNLFKFISPEEFELVKNNQVFTPLLTQNHKVYEPICRYENGMYYELNNSWYLGSVPARHVESFGEWAKLLGIPNPDYVPFAPGGSYLLTRERVRRHDKSLYERMRDMLPWSVKPGEAQLCERSYYLLWS